VNGSGLFGEAAFSPRELTTLLRRAHELTRGGFVEVLPKSREQGTIKRRFKALPKGAVRAKTGTLNGVSTLCGYLTTRAAQDLTFCVMMSGFSKDDLRLARRLQDEMVSEAWRLASPKRP
jgi:D-alanyl-D-alanine carboxypeptidase/D-alanyl-D-alanine-endopeptidase (penicillin-binding protein 4)